MVADTKSKFKVPQPLREIIMRLGGQESKDEGLFFKENLDAKDQALGIGYIDFRPDKNGKPRPKGWCYYSDGSPELKVDEATLNSVPFLATYRRLRDEYLDQMAKQLAGEEESPVTSEFTVPATKKTIDQVNAEAKEKYGENKPAVIEPQVMAQSAKSEPSQEPSQNTALSTTSAGDNKLVVGINKNRQTAVTINGVEIPNEHIFWYGIRKAGKVVNAKPYIDIKGLEYLATKMDILYVDPRSKDPNFPINQLVPAIDIEIVKSPWVDNNLGPKGVALVRGIVRTKSGIIYTDIGSAAPENLNGKQKQFPLEQAIARGRGRALRVATFCSMCSYEEADLKIDGNNVVVKGVPNENGEIIDAEFSLISSSSSGE